MPHNFIVSGKPTLNLCNLFELRFCVFGVVPKIGGVGFAILFVCLYALCIYVKDISIASADA
jgi:hypothetical protein